MIQRLTAWFPVLLLAAVAAVTVWLDRHVQPPEIANTGKARHDPDYIAENFTVTRIGPDGAVRYKMKARRMQHYPDDDTTDLEAPNVVNFRDAGITMTASSKTAKLSSNGDDVYLQDDVRLTRSAYENHSELVMLTTWLHVVPDAPLLVRQHADYLTRAKGGHGAAREACELSMHAQGTLEPALAAYLK